jgi:hypothetical protein
MMIIVVMMMTTTTTMMMMMMIIIKKLRLCSLYCYEATVLNMEAVLFYSRQKQEMFLSFGPHSLVVGPSEPLSTGVVAEAGS